MTMRPRSTRYVMISSVLAVLAIGCPAGPTVEPTQPSGRSGRADDFAFVIVADRPYAIVGDGQELLDAARPLEHVLRDHGWHVLASTLETHAVPPALRAFGDATFTVLDASGARCEARAEGLVLLASVFEPDDLLDPAVTAGAQTLSQLEALHEGGGTAEGQGAVMLATPLRIDADCTAPQWAWNAAAAPWLATMQPPPPALERQVLEAVRSHPEVAQIQARYAEESGGEGHWTELDALPPPSGEDAEPPRLGFDGLALQRPARVQVFDSPRGDPLVVFSVRNAGVCGDFSAAATLVWSVRQDGSLAPKPQLESFGEDALVPDAVIDVDDDGAYELLERTDYYGQLASEPPRRLRTAILQPC